MEIPPLPDSFYLGMKAPRRSSYLLPGLVWLFVGIGWHAIFWCLALVSARLLAP